MGRESRGFVKDVYDPVMQVRQPLSEYRTMLDLIHREPTLAAAFRIIVNFATYRGYDFIRGTRAQRDHWRELFITLDVQELLPNVIYTLCYYGDCFLELRKNESKTPNELWVLETTEMRIIYDEHGKVHGYVQRPFNMEGLTEEEVLEEELKKVKDPETGEERTQGIFFDEEDVIHFRMKWIGSQVYSYNPNEPIAVTASTRLYAGNYLMNIFLNMPPRYVAHLAGISDRDYNLAKHEFRSSKTNYKKTIAFTKSSDATSKLELKKIDAPYDKELIEIIKWLNNEMLKITGVPRSWIEESGIENRGVTEAEQRPFDVLIQWIHRCVLEPGINRKLLPKLEKAPKEEESKVSKLSKDSKDKKPKSKNAKKKVQFRFNEISRKGEKEILENIRVLKEMGLKSEAVVSYLDERGILGLDPDDFEEPEMMQGGMGMGLSKPPGAFPSRQKMNKSTQDMTQKRNEAGTSDKSAKKMAITKN